ncbi:MAG: cytochrome c peroxidase [Bacteroidota bacterium]
MKTYIRKKGSGALALTGSILAMLVLMASSLTPDPPIIRTPVQLGEKLFNDPILSVDNTISCASCHKPEMAFTDGLSFSMGVTGKPTGRNTPSVTYLSKRKVLFWDGRASSLEEQAMGPITHPDEMGFTIGAAVERLRANDFYKEAFLRVYNRQPDSILMLRAIADFERSLETFDSPYDEFLAGDDGAISESAKRGMIIFFKETTCATEACHFDNTMGGDSIVSLGIYNDQDKGLYGRTNNPSDVGKFRSMPLRNIAITAPYMHDGSKQTLEEVIRFYNEPENFKDPRVHWQASTVTKKLTDQDVDDMVAFMESLTDARYLHLLPDRTEKAPNRKKK